MNDSNIQGSTHDQVTESIELRGQPPILNLKKFEATNGFYIIS